MTTVYPVVAEIWSNFEQTLLNHAKRLAEDIAREQKADPKELWSHIKGMVKIGLLDIDIPDGEQTCAHIASNDTCVIQKRCREPCLLGFTSCPSHINSIRNEPQSSLKEVKRVLDFMGIAYYVDGNNIARDENGIPKGVVVDKVLYLFRENTQ